MATLTLGDSVVCRLRDNAIISVYENEADEEIIFDIIAVYDDSYIIYIPSDRYIVDSIYITKSNYKLFNLEKKFIDCYVCRITEHKVFRVHSKLDGMACCKCKQFYQMAVATQDDNTLICWNCKNYKFYQ